MSNVTRIIYEDDRKLRFYFNKITFGEKRFFTIKSSTSQNVHEQRAHMFVAYCVAFNVLFRTWTQIIFLFILCNAFIYAAGR